ncbi:type II toxin-antitoxin system mRNA interferase toxin, RelE/StbE family [Candidatus Uhrbacteria bacterium]|nr:type II toxin-antitoxin system mRNA interferase toxin, RelE/StbE family [Candidatus Uhrbacteria bacterium]
MEVLFAPSFFRLLKKLPEALQEEIFEKIDLFRDPVNHVSLKVHKLHGKLKGSYSFSVNYKTRVVFEYRSIQPKEALLLAIGDHDVYN